MELDWKISDDHFDARSPVGTYTVGEGARRGSALSVPGKGTRYLEVTLEEAMEIAQEDFDRRHPK